MQFLGLSSQVLSTIFCRWAYFAFQIICLMFLGGFLMNFGPTCPVGTFLLMIWAAWKACKSEGSKSPVCFHRHKDGKTRLRDTTKVTAAVSIQELYGWQRRVKCICLLESNTQLSLIINYLNCRWSLVMTNADFMTYVQASKHFCASLC